MTKCLSPEEFNAFLNGDLNSDASDDALEHIRSCDECRRELELYQRTDDLVKRAHNEIVPRSEWLADMQTMLLTESMEIQAKTLEVNYRIRYFAGLATAALLLIAATLAVWSFRDGLISAWHLSDKVAQDVRPIEPPTTPSDQTGDDSPSASNEPTVLAQGGFLVGKYPDDEDEIEVYWVLPVPQKQ